MLPPFVLETSSRLSPTRLFQNYVRGNFCLLLLFPMGNGLLSSFSLAASEVGAEEVKASETPEALGTRGESTCYDGIQPKRIRGYGNKDSACTWSPHSGDDNASCSERGACVHFSFIHPTRTYGARDMARYQAVRWGYNSQQNTCGPSSH